MKLRRALPERRSVVRQLDLRLDRWAFDNLHPNEQAAKLEDQKTRCSRKRRPSCKFRPKRGRSQAMIESLCGSSRLARNQFQSLLNVLRPSLSLSDQ